MRIGSRQRPGLTVVESACVYPIVVMFIIGLIVGATGVLRYQEVASLARRAARYASVHGSQYAKMTGNTLPSATDIYNAAIVPNAVALDLSKLNYSITYAGNSGALYQTSVVNGSYVFTTNTVTVTVSYTWIPEAFLGGITLKSTSVMPMSN